MTNAVESTSFRAAMSRLGAAVNIISTDGPAGRHGMTATAVCSVTDEPATLSVCVNRSSRMSVVIAQNGTLCVNVLSGEQAEFSRLFADRAISVEDPFARAQWKNLTNGVPTLSGALSNFGCSVECMTEVGTHTVFFCRVEELRTREDGEGLVYFGRNYHRLPQEFRV